MSPCAAPVYLSTSLPLSLSPVLALPERGATHTQKAHVLLFKLRVSGNPRQALCTPNGKHARLVHPCMRAPLHEARERPRALGSAAKEFCSARASDGRNCEEQELQMERCRMTRHSRRAPLWQEPLHNARALQRALRWLRLHGTRASLRALYSAG